ncbi:hypothetical protein CEXT_705801 [Caerostris extrusa]|uniref:Uncharacterized protein n=1 Tax=Caerostris extrusa TaxID=172846 RepID=A0AAV4SCB2_CAEEX|nr:hypothetical protein CEXT_705801 [Caerostris extrusa]
MPHPYAVGSEVNVFCKDWEVQMFCAPGKAAAPGWEKSGEEYFLLPALLFLLQGIFTVRKIQTQCDK